jgi:TRAP-type C4-dicarboxylate transport system permease small subunit
MAASSQVEGAYMDELDHIERAGHSPLEKVLEWIVVPLMLGLIAIGFIAVCLRFFAGGYYALFWSEEVIRYGFIWLFWLCAPILVWQGAMFTVDMFVGALPKGLQQVLRLVVNLLIMLIAGIYTYQGWLMTEVNMEQQSSALEVPLAYVYFSIPFGCALIFLITAYQSLKLVGVLGSSVVKP